MSMFLEIVLPVLSFTAIGVIAWLLIRRIGPVITNAQPDAIDCTLYVIAGSVTAMQGGLAGEDAFKYVNPYVLFWMKIALLTLGGGAISMKAFRSGRPKKTS